MTTIDTAKPDAGMTEVEAMSLDEISTELAGYKPSNRAEVIAIEAWLARRRALWRRLDELTGVRKPAIARPVAS
jgi:hypothetical protein